MPIEPPTPLDRGPVTERRLVYRFVHVEDENQDPPVEDFQSDREAGKRATPREKVYAELQDGMSVYGSLDKARELWAAIASAAARRGQEVRLGNHIAEVELLPDQGYEIEDLREPDEHMTIWGDQNQLATAVRRIYPAATNTE